MRVLIVDDDLDHVAAYQRALRALPQVKEACFVRDAESAILALTLDDDEPPWDLVCLGYVAGYADVCDHVTNLPREKLPRLVACHSASMIDNAKMMRALGAVAYVRAVATPYDRRMVWMPGLLAVKKAAA